MTSAPGKLFLIGEYAVLYGGAATLVPVPQRAFATLKRDGRNRLITHLSETSETALPIPGELTGGLLFDAVIAELACSDQLKNVSLTLDTHQFFSNGVKLGLGSSAALTAALVRLLVPDVTLRQQLELAISCHRRFQSGRGSGADIALSIMDTPIAFMPGETPQAVRLPNNLKMLAIWTGVSASTTDYLHRLEAWRQEDEVRADFHIDRLKDLSTTFNRTSSADEMVSLLHRYDRYLDEFSGESRLNFYNEPHIALQKEVELARCVYKPSGAGGGDFGIAFSTDENDLIILAEKLKEGGRTAFFLQESGGRE